MSADFILKKAYVKRTLSEALSGTSNYVPQEDVRTPNPNGEYFLFDVVVLVSNSIQKTEVEKICMEIQEEIDIKIKVLLI